MEILVACIVVCFAALVIYWDHKANSQAAKEAQVAARRARCDQDPFLRLKDQAVL